MQRVSLFLALAALVTPALAAPISGTAVVELQGRVLAFDDASGTGVAEVRFRGPTADGPAIRGRGRMRFRAVRLTSGDLLFLGPARMRFVGFMGEVADGDDWLTVDDGRAEILLNTGLTQGDVFRMTGVPMRFVGDLAGGDDS